MAESSRSWNESEAISVPSGVVKEKLDFFLQLARKCMEEVHGLPTQKFNTEQCSYLVCKLEVAVEIASLFLVWSQVHPKGPYITMHIARQTKNLEYLVALAKEIESFVQSCSKDTWMESALTLIHAAEYVSSLGFNLELCKIAFGCGQTTPRSLTTNEVCKINKDEVEIVVKKASIDKITLLKKVTFELNSSDSKKCSLAKHLVHQLVEVQPKPTSDEDNVLLRLYKWVVSGKKTKQLGRGSSAIVHEVKWFGIPAAKKTFIGPENDYFLREVEILSQFRHPNITSMFCCHMHKRSCSIIMELMDGDLRTLMLERQLERNNDAPPFTMLEGVDLMLQVSEGVNYLHDQRIVHRDLKSSNILVKNVEVSGLGLGYVQAKVVDFGLSKTKEKSTYSVMTYNVGTFRWMAPEVINIIKDHEEVYEASEKLENHVFKVDIYSFAMVCFEILTGELPFTFEPSPTIVKEMVLKGERPKIPDYCPQILKTLIEKCWSQIPSERSCISDVCLQLKYIKYLLMTDSNFVDACESMVTNIVPTKMDCGPTEIFVVHQLHPQVGDISTSVPATLIFFHGFHKSPEEWRGTWMTRDNKLLWPQEWLPADLGAENVRVLSVSFDENTTTSNLQEIGKNVVNSLVLSLEWKLGESDGAIFLIGHSFGGVLIKNLVTEARHVVQNSRGQQEALKCEKFLERLAKIVFYSVPHAEFENYISECRRIVGIRESFFLQSLEGDSQFVVDMNKLSAEFENAIPEKPQILAFLEGKAMRRIFGFKESVLVTHKSCEGASNRWEWHKIDEDNHFEVCRPNSKEHTGYRILLQHLHQHLNDPYGVTSTLASDFTRVLGKRQRDDLAFPAKSLSSWGEGSSTSAIVSVTPEHSTLIIDSSTANDFSRYDPGDMGKSNVGMSFSDDYKTLPEVQRALAEAGLECSNLIVGIDFTKSNEWTGKHSFGGRSLHAIGGNPYEQVLGILGKTLASFDDDNLIPCFGFGDALTNGKHVFSFYPDHRPCQGFEEALSRYRQIAPKVCLAGPTSFAPIIHTAVDIVVKSGGQYHVLVIIADGQMTRSGDTAEGVLSPQEQATVAAIVTASSFSLSIVLVGVGDGPWDMIQQLDDNIPARAFNNFQFINFTNVMSTRRDDPPQLKEAQFALGALMKIPSQYKACVRLGHLGRQRTGPLMPPPMDAQNSTSAARSRVTDEAAESNECPFCFHNKKNMAFNCGHQTCLDCASKISSCPTCRVAITNRLRLY